MPGLVEEIITIVVGGYEIRGFEEIDVRRSMKEAAIAFSLKATWPQGSTTARMLRQADEIEIYTSPASGARRSGRGELLCRGAIDSYEADIGEGNSKTIVLHGRSHARDAIDCTPVRHKTGRVENKDLLGVANDLGAEFDVKWSTDVKLDKIDKVQRRPDDTLFQTIEREARTQGLMLLGLPEGGVRFTRAGTTRHAGALREGMPPVNRVSVRLQKAAERSEIHARGQRAHDWDDDALLQDEVLKPDYPVRGTRRHRPQAVYVEGDRHPNMLKRRAGWQHLRSFEGNAIQLRVSRWRDEGGLIWEPGRLMALQVPSEELDVDFTLSEVTLRQGIGQNAGTRAELVFVDPRTHGGDKPMAGKTNGGGEEYDPGEGLGEDDG
jgi:prophage tail gpP-like protein